MHEVVIVEAVRTPFGKVRGALSAMHPADLLAAAMRGCLDRADIDPGAVGQVVAGCVEQVGEQAANIARLAWISAGLPDSVASVSLDSACGSSQQAVGLAAALVGSGTVDVAMACGVASMSRLPIASSFNTGFAAPPTRRLEERDLMPEMIAQTERYGMGQFGSAERIADIYGITREDADRYGLASQERAARAWDEGRFAAEVVPVSAPVCDAEGEIAAELRLVERDEGLRETSLDKLAALKPVARPDGVHTAGTSSQISDGAAALLVMTPQRADQLGLRARARIVDHCHVGVDPVLMLTGPLDATRTLVKRNAASLDDIDVFEVNEAFAAVPLMWAREFGVTDDRLNPNGGGIALGHPVGATGARLIATAMGELERRKGGRALITMCAGGGLGTGTLIERCA